MKTLKKYAGAVLSATLLLALAGFGLTYRNEIWAVLTRKDARDAFIAYVHDGGFIGVLAFLGLQILQVVVAVLPGEPVERLALCLLGIAVSSMAIYYCVRAAGARSIDPAILSKYRFLRDEAHVKLFLFLLFFIPGTPKDALIYLGPFLPMKPFTFLLLATMGRIPSILSSTFVGSQFAAGSWKVSLAVAVGTGPIAALCVLFQDRIIAAIASLRERLRRAGPERGAD